MDELNQFSQGMAIDTAVAGPTGFDVAGKDVVDDATLTIGSRLQIMGNAGSGNSLSHGGTSFSSSNPNMGITFADTEDSNAVGESIFTSLPVYDSLGNELTVNITAVLVDKTDAGTSWRYFATSPSDTEYQPDFVPNTASPTDGQVIGSGVIQFDNDGKLLTNTQPTLKLNRVAIGSGSPLSVSLDFSKMTALADTQSSLLSSEQDGDVKIGVLNGFIERLPMESSPARSPTE